MKGFCYKKWVRILAGILCILSFNLAVGSFIGFVAMMDMGIYDRNRKNVEKESFDRIQEKYSVLAMSRYQDDFGMEELSDTNFRYGVIQTDSIEGLDLNDKNIYEVCNFDREVTEDQLYIYSCNMGENTCCEVGERLSDYYYIDNMSGTYTESAYPIEACYYVRNTGNIYYLAKGQLYPEHTAEITSCEGDMPMDLSREIVINSGTEVNPEQQYVWKDSKQQVAVGDMIYYLSDINIVTTGELEQVGRIVPEQEYVDGKYAIREGSLMTYEYEYADTKPYFVLSYVNNPLTDEDNYLMQNLYNQIFDAERQDFFLQISAILNFAYSIQYGIYIVFFVSVIICLVTFGMVMTGAGHEKNYEGIREGYIEKLPFDILTCIVSGMIGFLILMTVEGVIELTIKFAFIIVFFGVLGSEYLAWRYFESMAIRIKKKKLWKSTFMYAFWKWCKNILGKMIGSIPFLWKAWLFMGALAVLEFLGIMATFYDPESQLLLWFLEKVVVYGVLSVCLLQMNKLRQSAKKIADGETDSRIDTTKMFWDFKEHGENLNCIRDGIGKAVTEQMKSEHFKTELITNVSHDIKTPLTSIINYVDLLEKEEIDNPKVQEYLEVLSRQSTRLKKLIEDLMEASKASTGNIEVSYECCDAGVMLTQTVGEFEEKLKAGQIELLVQDSKESVYIQADPRHLWRIFDNLMNNICKYAQASTRAYVNIENDGKYGRIIFRNISKYALNIDSDALMERFVRGDSSRHTEGNGLGLSIARSLTELMQGTFELVIDGDLFKVILTFPITDRSE